MSRTISFRRVSYGALFCIAATLCGCSGTSSTSAVAPPHGSPISPDAVTRDVAFDARFPAVATKLAAGYVFEVTGTAQGYRTREDGTQALLLGHNHHITIMLKPWNRAASNVKLDSASQRAVQYDFVNCDGCLSDPNDPVTVAGRPPNADSCQRSGGATWWDIAYNSGGCLMNGTQYHQLSCGLYTWYARGQGKLIQPGGYELDAINWIADHGDGSCHLG